MNSLLLLPRAVYQGVDVLVTFALSVFAPDLGQRRARGNAQLALAHAAFLTMASEEARADESHDRPRPEQTGRAQDPAHGSGAA